jgi:hypothetical protein
MTEDEVSLTAPGFFGRSENNVVVLTDFVSKEDIRTIQRFTKSITEWDNPKPSEFSDDGTCIYDASYWWDRMCSGSTIQRLAPEIYDLVDSYIYKMRLVLEEKFKVTLRPRPPVLIRWLPGNEQQPHADKQLNDGSPNPFPLYDINSIIYWNGPPEFEGGQLYYPDFDLELEVKPGMAVAHPGDINYLHGVRPVLRGERWTTPSFYTVTEVTK